MKGPHIISDTHRCNRGYSHSLPAHNKLEEPTLIYSMNRWVSNTTSPKILIRHLIINNDDNHTFYQIII